MKQKVLGLVGPKGSGKGTIAKHLATNYGAISIAYVDILHEILRQLDIPLTRINAINLALALKQTYGDEVLGKAMAKRLTNLQAPLIIVDGIRYQSDYLWLKEKFDFKLVYVDAALAERYQRILQRGKTIEEAGLSWEQFLHEEGLPTELNIPKIGQQADLVINNDTTRSEVIKQTDNLAAQLGLAKILSSPTSPI